MKFVSHKSLIVCLVGWSLLAGIAKAQETPTTPESDSMVANATVAEGNEDEVPTASISGLQDKYQVIVDRNPFNLQPPAPPPPPEVEEEPVKEEVDIKELNLILAGVSSRKGDKRVWLSMTVPATDSTQEPVQRFYGFRENDQQHGITVKSIESNGDVAIEYDGEPILLTLETHGNKKQQKAKSKSGAKSSAKNNVRTARTRTGSTPTASARTGSNRTTTSNRSTTANRMTGNTVPVGRSSANTRTIPSRPVRTQPQVQLSREEQITLLETQRTLAEQEGRPFPPLPPLRQ